MSSVMVLSHMDTVIIHVPVIPNTKATKCQTLNAQNVSFFVCMYLYVCAWLCVRVCV